MNILDYIILGGLLVGLVLGIWKGFLKQALALVGVAVCAIGTTYLAPYVNGWFGSISQENTRSIVALIVTFLVLSAVYALISVIISKAVNKMPVLGWLNRLLGALFAVGVVYLVCAVLVSVILHTGDNFLPKIKGLVKGAFEESWIVKHIYGGVDHPEKNFFGNWLIQTLADKINALKSNVLPSPEPTPEPSPEPLPETPAE